ncbi:pyridoxal phosphate-dependent decarboxylase family protein [Almyronema epifaneia]|uniref:Pyridoxal phosphate-dependent decarboxylase family protein n=1 Tax=Almyronema epifaneia S1 TaxID=2991925 RepID=A0ABW6IJG5_9CYAN
MNFVAQATSPPSPSLQPTAAEMYELVNTVMKYIVSVQANPDQLPLAGSGYQWLHQRDRHSDTEAAIALARSLQEPLPEQGTTNVEALLQDLFEQLAPHSLNTNGGGYLGFIPSGGLFHAALADFIALSLNRYVPIFMAAPGLAAIEAQAVQWLCNLMDLPATAGGLFTSGGSIATLTALHAARQQHFADQPPTAWLQGTVYVSEQAHYCLEKGLAICGLPRQNLRQIPVDDQFRLRLDILEATLQQDIAAGYQPFLIAANAGTTNTGAIDNLLEMGRLARTYRTWFHVDAAYGGFFKLTQRGQRLLRGIEQADSIVLDPHKSLFLPYGTGALLVRDRTSLQRAFDFTGSYMPARSQETSPLEEDMLYLSPELTRDFRGLRLWLPLKLLGVQPFRSQLDDKLDLARWAATQLSNMPHMQLVAEPQLSILAFKLQPDAAKLTAQDLDDLNRALLDAINERGNILLTPFKGQQPGEFAIRMAILSFRTTAVNLQQGLKDIQQAASQVLHTRLGWEESLCTLQEFTWEMPAIASNQREAA